MAEATKRFLVISSDSVGRDLLDVTLKLLGGFVKVVTSSLEAIEAIGTDGHFDAVFVDIRQGAMNETNVCAELMPHKSSGHVRQIIVVVERSELERSRVFPVRGTDAVMVWPMEEGDISRVLAMV